MLGIGRIDSPCRHLSKSVDFVQKHGCLDNLTGPLLCLQGALRLIDIDSVDINPCGGTHVRSLAELQLLKVTGLERSNKGPARVRFLVGGRALQALGTGLQREAALTKVGGLLACLGCYGRAPAATKAVLTEVSCLQIVSSSCRPGRAFRRRGERWSECAACLPEKLSARGLLAIQCPSACLGAVLQREAALTIRLPAGCLMPH